MPFLIELPDSYDRTSVSLILGPVGILLNRRQRLDVNGILFSGDGVGTVGRGGGLTTVQKKSLL